MAFVSTFEFEVRSYELDVYNHVNNAVYINWLEHGRSKLLQDKGLNYTTIISEWGVQFMTVRTEIDYRKPLHLGDKVTLTTQVERVGTSSVTLAQKVLCGGEPAAEAKVVIVYTDIKTGRPAPVPKEFIKMYT
ncbi:MAG: acyl-CoA thioesterase [Planctomycetes bacterium]|nr:acyl-CoA thioesterase [Planctomycetota bacterium]